VADTFQNLQTNIQHSEVKLLQIGQYMLADFGDNKLWIAHTSGETGVFNKHELEPYIAAFFGLHF